MNVNVLKSPYLCVGIVSLLLASGFTVWSRLPTVNEPRDGEEEASWVDVSLREARRGDSLEGDRNFLIHNSGALQAIYEDLAKGRITLKEAVAALRAADARRPPHLRLRPELYPYIFPGATVEEQFAHMAVVNSCGRFSQLDPARFPAVRARLQAELQAYLRELKGDTEAAGADRPHDDMGPTYE